MRLFIAIELDPEMRRAVADMQTQMRRQRVSASFTPAENLHLTLAFIGDYPSPEDVPLPGFAPFELRLEGCGCFGDLWWAGLQDSPALMQCVRAQRHALAQAGIPFDRKRFRPHITLARRVSGQPAIIVPPASMTAVCATLMRSDRGKQGMIYTPLRTSPEEQP